MAILRLAISLFLLFAIGLDASAASKKKAVACETALATSMIEELALFYIEMTQIEEENWKALAFSDFKKKYRQVERELGVDIKPLVNERIRMLQGQAIRDSQAKKKQVDKIRTKQKEAAVLGRVIFSQDMGQLHTLDDTYIDKSVGDLRLILGSGIKWTADEKYVFIRNFDGEHWFFNTEKEKFFSLPVKAGLISEHAHIFLETVNRQTIVHDLDNKKKWGPFNSSEPIMDYAFDEFIVVKSGDDIFTLIDYRGRKELRLGTFFVITRDRKRVFVKVEGGFQEIDIATQKNLQFVEGNSKHTHYRDDFFEFFRGRTGYIHRVADGKSFKYAGSGDMSRDGSLMFKVAFGRDSHVKVTDLDGGGTDRVYKGYSEAGVFESGGPRAALIHSALKKSTIYFDLATKTETRIDGDFDTISANGRWLYSYGWNSEKNPVYDVKTGSVFTVEGDDIKFIGSSDHFVYQRRTGTNDVGVFYSDASNGGGALARIGNTSSSPSPRGTYLFTYRDGGKVTLLKW